MATSNVELPRFKNLNTTVLQRRTRHAVYVPAQNTVR